MEVLLLCGYFESAYQEEITAKTKTWVENAANTFQKKIINGLKEQKINLTVISAPFIGPWPTTYSDIIFKGFSDKNNKPEFDIKYVYFNNIWGYRNISRTKVLKKSIEVFIKKTSDKEKAIIVYSPHTPFLEAAVYAKKLDSSIHICMIVPDLPQYMNLSKKSHLVYDFFKKIDIWKFKKLNKQVDSYMVLTKYMVQELDIGKRPYIIIEGIADINKDYANFHKKGKKVVYAGKLMESFGLKKLVEAFEMIKDKDATLEICGGGELKDYILEMVSKDSRIHYHGIVSSEEAQKLLWNADVLVNPRQNDSEYTKYSFPSKNVEYLQTGNAVVAYMLDGIPEVYREFFWIPKDSTVQSLSICITEALESSSVLFKAEQARLYLEKERCPYAICKKLIEMIF